MAEAYARKFYASSEWIALRAALIQERGLVCERCKKIIIDTSKLIGHHIIPITPDNIDKPDIVLNKKNIILICFDCHNEEHQRYGHTKSHAVYIVYGSPFAGKKTMVNQLMQRGDLVINMDLIYQAISGRTNIYDKPDNLKLNVFRVRDVLLDMVKTRYGKWYDAYIIGGYPARAERERLALSLGAELIYCKATQSECLARAQRCGVFAEEWGKYVIKWWEMYQE